MKTIQVYPDGHFVLPNKYSNIYPLRITTAWVKIFIYHKKDSPFESQVIYHAQHKPYIPEGLVKINDDTYRLRPIYLYRYERISKEKSHKSMSFPSAFY